MGREFYASGGRQLAFGRHATVVFRGLLFGFFAICAYLGARGASVGLHRLLIIGASAILVATAYVGTRYYATADAAVAPHDISYRLAIGEQAILRQGAGAAPPVLKAREGDHVKLLVTSAVPAELYIHGPEIKTTLLPDLETPLTFFAKDAGRYYVHLHNVMCAFPHQSDDSHVEVAVIEVEPR